MPGQPQSVLIPAAGLGTRMRGVRPDLAPDLPKELLPIAGRPAIQYALAEALEAGIRRAAVIVRPGKQDLERYLTDPGFAAERYPAAALDMARIRKALDIEVLHQQEPRGECPALALAQRFAANRPVAVIYPDNVRLAGPNALCELLAAFAERPGDMVGLMAVDEKNAAGISDSGRVDLEGEEHGLFRIKAFLEKGPGAFRPRFPGELRTCGIYLALPHFFELIARAQRAGFTNELTDNKVRRLMLEQKIEFWGLRLGGSIFDVGNPEGYRQCVEAARDLDPNQASSKSSP
ncbi:MAG: NTP transferase domain-containing protein [Desulfovibrionaceae bacterium]|nr:NTP transferase domain-containing protein [Desulfovibrionaceae bacterium]